MALAFRSLLYRRVYAALGVPVTLSVRDTTYDVLPTGDPLLAIDESKGSPVGKRPPQIDDTVPAAVMMSGDLEDLGLSIDDDLSGSLLAMNGDTWKVVSYQANPSPRGPSDGELFLILEEFL